LRFEPCVPTSWPAYEITYKHGLATYRIRFDNAKGIGRGVQSVTLDGNPVMNKSVPLIDDSHTHDVQVTIG
jgi:cellobiose phosphorylase